MLCVAWGVLATPLAAQTRSDFANLREDVNLLSQQVSRMQLEMENLKRQNNELARELRNRDARIQELSSTVSGLTQTTQGRIQSMREGVESSERQLRKEIIDEVTRQIEALAAQTQKAFDELAQGMSGPATASTPAFEFSDDYPRTGIAYEVKSGDTLSGIARAHNSRVRDIQNANRIAQPRELRVGQTIFIPQRN